MPPHTTSGDGGFASPLIYLVYKHGVRPLCPPHVGAPGGLRFKPSFFIRLSFSHLLHNVASLAVHFFMRTLRDVAEDFVFIYLTSTI